MRPSTSSSSTLALRAAAATAQAARLREAARILRSLAGALKYHPLTGERPAPSAELEQGLFAVQEVVDEIQRGAGDRAGDESAIAPHGETALRRVRHGHQAVDAGAHVAGAAIAVLRGILSSPEQARLDAPYGHGAPRRHHPGALCTIVAARAESLATALESVAIAKLNLTGAR